MTSRPTGLHVRILVQHRTLRLLHSVLLLWACSIFQEFLDHRVCALLLLGIARGNVALALALGAASIDRLIHLK